MADIIYMKIEEVEKQAPLDSPEKVFVKRAKERGLWEDIEKNGIKEPIELDGDSFRDGQHRFVVAKRLGHETVPVIQL
jgi:ParB-like chromosome segregation protein Spo0J